VTATRHEPRTTVCCAHPYFGFACAPHAVIDFSDRVPAEFGHGAVAVIDGRGFRDRTFPTSSRTACITSNWFANRAPNMVYVAAVRGHDEHTR